MSDFNHFFEHDVSEFFTETLPDFLGTTTGILVMSLSGALCIGLTYLAYKRCRQTQNSQDLTASLLEHDHFLPPSPPSSFSEGDTNDYDDPEAVIVTNRPEEATFSELQDAIQEHRPNTERKHSDESKSEPKSTDMTNFVSDNSDSKDPTPTRHSYNTVSKSRNMTDFVDATNTPEKPTAKRHSYNEMSPSTKSFEEKTSDTQSNQNFGTSNNMYQNQNLTYTGRNVVSYKQREHKL